MGPLEERRTTSDSLPRQNAQQKHAHFLGHRDPRTGLDWDALSKEVDAAYAAEEREALVNAWCCFNAWRQENGKPVVTLSDLEFPQCDAWIPEE